MKSASSARTSKARAGLPAIYLLLTATAAPSWAKDKFEKWIEDEVRWIASEAEKEAFKSLTTRESKNEFIEEFWKRRDPTPATTANEYKGGYYERWDYVNRQFREGMPGWRTDRGRVYLIHGPPDGVETLDRSGGNAYGLGDRGHLILWRYSRLEPPLDVLGATVLVFRADSGLSQPAAPGRTVSREGRPLMTRSGSRDVFAVPASVRYRLVAAGPPGLVSSQTGGAAQDSLALRDVLRAPADLDGEYRKRDPGQGTAARRSEMRQQIEAAVHFDALKVDMSCLDFRGDHGTEVVLAWEWEAPQLSLESSPPGTLSLDLMAALRTSQGEAVDEFFKTFELIRRPEKAAASESGKLAYLGGFRVPAGDFEVLSLLRIDASEKMGSSSCNLTVQPATTDGVSTSALILSRGVMAEGSLPGDPSVTGYDFGRHLLWEGRPIFPNTSGVFTPEDALILFLKIYGAEPHDEAPKVVLSYQFLRDGQVYRSNGARIIEEYSDAQKREMAFGALIELQDFEAGAYQIQVSVIDFHTRKFATRRAEFEVASPPR